MHRGNWDDLRFVLAVADKGSVSAAARALGVNHATVLRRIQAFEEAQGAPIFERSAQGYSIPPDRLRAIEAAREAAHAIEAVGRLIRGAQNQMTGAIRVTSTDSLSVSILPGVVADLQAASPGLSIDLISTNAHVDLGRRAADLTVRPAPRLPEDMAGEKAAEMAFAAYAAPGAAECWLGFSGILSRSVMAAWMERELPEVARGAGSDSFVVLRELAAAGQGRAILPCCLGDPDSRLQRLPDQPVPPPVAVWVACHTDLADAPRLRALRRRLVQAVADRSPQLAGVRT